MHVLKSTAAGSLALLFFAGCGGGREQAPAAAGDPPVRVVVATAAKVRVPSEVQAAGAVLPLVRVSPGTKILGRVERVLVDAGEKVARGQLLARLESRDLEAAVAMAQAGVESADAALENARAQRDRMLGLTERGSATAKNLEDASAAFRMAQAGLAQAQAGLAAAKVMLSYAEIRSPLAGWVVERRIEAGDMASPGAPLFTLEDLSKVKVEVQVAEADIEGLLPGAPAVVETLGRRAPATIDAVVPAGEAASRTFTVRLLLENPDGALKSGMFARAAFPRGEEELLLVPETAIVTRGQLEGVFVAGDDGKARLRWLRTGRRSDGRAAVISGLEPGERYLVAPPTGLVDGAAIAPEVGG